MSETLTPALRVVMYIAGIALITYAGYLHYVALPSEQAIKHVLTRAGLAAVGLFLVLLGIWFLR